MSHNKLDALILDFLDDEYPISRAAVHRIKSDRTEADEVRARVEALIESGEIVVVRGDKLLRRTNRKPTD